VAMGGFTANSKVVNLESDEALKNAN
jgi:hypothetical protein